jgi:aspartate beta-hydroxylase
VTQVVQHLESHVDTIRDEYLKVAPTLKSDYEDTDMKGLHQGEWEWYSYLNKGSVQGNFALQFPNTSKVLQQLRDDHLMFEGTPFGFSFFSTLHGNASIQAHTAPMNLRLRIHLPLIVPSESENYSDEDAIPCGMRVGPIVRPWIQDKALVFDDAYDHEVWNRTNQKRVLLLVDIWHPDIMLAEKQEIVQIFQNAKQQGLWKR